MTAEFFSVVFKEAMVVMEHGKWRLSKATRWLSKEEVVVRDVI